MATYNKRGYKAPKEKEEKDSTFIEDVKVDEKDSTTAGVFNSLDQTASKTEEWVARNQKYIFGVVAAIALVTVSYLMYQKFIVQPKEDEAATEMFDAQQNFQKAVDAPKSADSLFNLCLKGAKGSLGFVEIADKYSGTSAGNLANYYAGISYLNTGKYSEAITSLENFKSDDMILSVLAVGAVGAYAQKKQPGEALEKYIAASEMNKNDLTTPRFLLKAGQTALALGKKADALKYFTEIKDKYESTPEGSSVDAMIGLAQ
jgi:tetratricopeptide (TPR) repeat protein